MSPDVEDDVARAPATGYSTDAGIEPFSADAAAEFPSADVALGSSTIDGSGEKPGVDGLSGMVADLGYSESPSADGGRPVAGAVLSASSGQGFAGRRVVIANESTVTDNVGRFSFPDVTGSYDLIVVEPGGWNVSIYYGLSRRDPMLSHSMSGGSSLDTLTHSVSITGTLAADFTFPVDSAHLVNVYYLGNHGHGAVQVGTGLLSTGPDFPPIRVGWNGKPSIVGRLVAVGQYGAEGTPWAKVYLGSLQLSLASGDKPSLDLTLSESSVGRIGGTIRLYSGNLLKGVDFTYYLPGMMGAIGLGRCSTTGAYSCVIPDLSTLGGGYCVSIVDIFGCARAKRCGGAIGMNDFSLQVQAPPQFQKPVDGSPITKDSKLLWTSISSGVYRLDLVPDEPSAASPRIQVYTSATQLRWPELGAIGVVFPAGSTYTCQVSGLSPYTSLDDFASSRGLFNNHMDRQWLDSAKIGLSLVQ